MDSRELDLQEAQPSNPPSSPRQKTGVMIVGLVVLVGLLGMFFVKSRALDDATDLLTPAQPTAIHSADGTSEATSEVEPTPFLFQEMTVPYLRSQTFTSALGDLRQQAEASAYTSYLTSYTSDDVRVNGLLTIPKGDRPSTGWPAVIFIHGYIPPATYRTTENYSAYVDYLARNGLVVFKIDLRGHGQSEGEAGGGYYAADYVIDTLNARAALAATDFVDTQAIGLWGHSMAGNIVMRSMVAQPAIPAAVIWAGAVYTYEDMQAYGIDDTSYRPPAQTSPRQQRRQLLRETYGNFDPQSWFWQQVAPTNYLQDVQGVVQLHHAMDDAVVSIEYSRNLAALLNQSGTRHELFEYPSGGHNLSGTSFNQAMQRTVGFYTQELLSGRE